MMVVAWGNVCVISRQDAADCGSLKHVLILINYLLRCCRQFVVRVGCKIDEREMLAEIIDLCEVSGIGGVLAVKKLNQARMNNLSFKKVHK